MIDLRVSAALAFVAMIGCADPADFATVSIGLDREIPASVSTISVFVVDLSRDVIVTSATIAAGQDGFLLGVPAEVPLDFLVTAWTDAPGPEGFGLMPAYVGGVRRTIPLGRERERVSVTVRPAGVLTILLDVESEPERRAPVTITVQPERADDRAASVNVASRTSVVRRGLVLTTGRYRAVVRTPADNESPRWRVEGGEGLHVAAEQESVAHLRLVPVRTSTSVDDAKVLALDVGASETLPVGSSFELQVRAFDGADRPVVEPAARVRWRVEASPVDAVRTAAGPDRGEGVGLPITVGRFSAAARGTVRFFVEAVLPDDRVLRMSSRKNVLMTGDVPGPPTRLRLIVDAPDRLRLGTELGIELLDGQGLFAHAIGQISLADSDPWLLFEQGPSVVIGPSRAGHVSRRIVRSSGPRDLPVVLRATFTSTVPLVTLTSTQGLPVLTLP